MTTDRNQSAIRTPHGGVTAVVHGPRLTEVEAPTLDRDLTTLLEGMDRPVVTLDLAAVAFLGGTALGRFAALGRTLRAAGGQLTLVNLGPHLRQVFTACRLGGLLARGEEGVFEQATRALAQRKWEEAGRPADRGDEFWYAAERELRVAV